MCKTDNNGIGKNIGKGAEELLSCSKSVLIHKVVLIFVWFQPIESLCARITIIPTEVCGYPGCDVCCISKQTAGILTGRRWGKGVMLRVGFVLGLY